MCHWIVACLLSLSHATSIHASALEMFTHSPVPGGIALVDLGPIKKELPRASFRGNSVAVVRDADNAWAVVGIGLSVDPGEHTLNVADGAQASRAVSFRVDKYDYPEQRIALQNDKFINPSLRDMKRIRNESRSGTDNTGFTINELLTESFSFPLGGRITSPFGLRRFYNDQPRRPHGGIDIAANRGTPIAAPANGIVIKTGNLFFDGNIVVLEHGLGLRSLYAHLDSIAVEPGDVISTGQLLGTVGSTGRVTGPHLHWSISLNGEWVDPMLLQ